MNTKLKKISIEDIAKKEASKKIKQVSDIPVQESQASVPYTKPKGEFEDKDVNSHPVLKKLKKLLGIKPLELHTKTIMVDGDKLDFSLTEYSEELVIYCAAEYRRAIMTIGEDRAMRRFDLLRIGCSLVAIDNSPIYEIFGVEIELEEMDRLNRNPYDLSDRLRKECAKIFCDKVLYELRGFIGELEVFFIEKIINASNISSYDSLADGQAIYVCSAPGCSFIHKDAPMYDDKGTEIPFVCAIHATPLKKALTTSERDNSPLA